MVEREELLWRIHGLVAPELERLRKRIGFVDEMQLTFIARLPGDEDADIVVTRDDFRELEKLCRRRRREEQAATGPERDGEGE